MHRELVCIEIEQNLPNTSTSMKSGIPSPTGFLATQEIFPSVSNVTGSIVQFNDLTSLITFPPRRQIYSVAAGRPSSSTPLVNVIESPFITVSTSFCKNARPGGSIKIVVVNYSGTIMDLDID